MNIFVFAVTFIWGVAGFFACAHEGKAFGAAVYVLLALISSAYLAERIWG